MRLLETVAAGFVTQEVLFSFTSYFSGMVYDLSNQALSLNRFKLWENSTHDSYV